MQEWKRRLRKLPREYKALAAVGIVALLRLAGIASDVTLRRAWALFLALFLVSTARGYFLHRRVEQ